MSKSVFFERSEASVKTVEALLKEARRFKQKEAADRTTTEQKPAIYLRGQADDTWTLVPSIGRPYKHAGQDIKFTLEQEKRLLERFRRYAHAYLGRTPKKWEALFIARHHGLPVRLLDWSSNPLVALYHAVKTEPCKDGAVWAILRKSDPDAHYDFLEKKGDPFDVRGVRMIYPIYITPRLNAQSGYFTIHGERDKHLDEDPTGNDADFDFLHLTRWQVPKADKANLIDELSRLAITEQTLYPDLDGLARGLWQTEVLREGSTH
jgi:FRG domain-containing protein